MTRPIVPVVLALALLPAGCGNRSLPGSADIAASKQDWRAAGDGRQGDGRPGRDLPAGDARKPRDGASPRDTAPQPDRPLAADFCKGPASLEIAKTKLSVTSIKTHVDYVASCCPAGEVITLQTANAAGQTVEVSLIMARFPNVPLPSSIVIDLSKPPSGWVVYISCGTGAPCSSLHSTNATFKGRLQITSLLGAPAIQVTACVTATPNSPGVPGAGPVKLWTGGPVTVNTVCVPSMPQTCNFDPLISSTKGTCNADSTCTCNPGSVKMANGKCQ